jgi:hypothetical protein
MTLAQRRNRLVTHLLEGIPVVKRGMAAVTARPPSLGVKLEAYH